MVIKGDLSNAHPQKKDVGWYPVTSPPNHLATIPGDPRAVSRVGRKLRARESFQVRAKEPLGTDSHRTISKNSSGCRLLIGHKKCFVLLCPIGEQFHLSSFREFVHDSYCFDHGLSGSCTKEMHTVRKLSLWYKIPIWLSYLKQKSLVVVKPSAFFFLICQMSKFTFAEPIISI